MNMTLQDNVLSPLNHVLKQHYGLQGELSLLNGEYDKNYRLVTTNHQQYLFKISQDSATVIQLQNAVLLYLQQEKHSFQTPQLLPSLTGVYDCVLAPANQTARLMTWLPGQLLGEVKFQSRTLLASLGRQVGALTKALAGFQHAAAKRESKWDLQQSDWVAQHLSAVQGHADHACVAAVIARFNEETAEVLPNLRHSVIHGDLNDYNILVTGDLGKEQVSGFIDFGDLIETSTINELAIAAAYGCLNKPDPLMAIAEIVRGYHTVFPLQEQEVDHLFNLVTMRLCVSVVNSAVRKQENPHDKYLTISEQPAWQALHLLSRIQPAFATYVLRAACHLTPCPQTTNIVAWLKSNTKNMAPLFDVDLHKANKVIFDLSPAGDDSVLQQQSNAITIGRYNEARCIYTSNAYHEVTNDGTENRTIHLGIDVGLPAGDAVYAPLDGVIHSVQDNGEPQDYGPTIILEHRIPEQNIIFYTLYGHLSRESLSLWTKGQTIKRGTRLGEIGSAEVNGGWAPHLHLQIITDLLENIGTFPGVARASQRDVWLSLCPDPNLLLQLPELNVQPAAISKQSILAARQQIIGSNLHLAYDEPLYIVRGRKQYLYDENGKQYLDCVNNVSHVGHSHPAVVKAAAKQLSQLNTNTRYLHENVVTFAKQLLQTLPASLSVCYFVNSGSEANELALRLAAAYTKKKNIVVLDHAYHGNTANLIAISPYKVNRAGQHQTPDHVRVLPLPDVLRQLHLTPVTEMSTETAAFICEALPSCAGQIELPAGYLQTIYQAARAAGAVCIADEVQTGLGRLGTHFWGFETQAVTPDIVTLGKPLGNGFPLGAVVTTRAIAEAFANEMEYFNTFGGNPVACAAGSAVLSVIEQEGLQEHALHVGTYLKQQLQALASRQPLITDVRGRGLYLGVELAKPALAAFMSARLREHGILISIDGPQHNVIKIKPPLVFSAENADRLVATLEQFFSFAV